MSVEKVVLKNLYTLEKKIEGRRGKSRQRTHVYDLIAFETNKRIFKQKQNKN